MPLVTTQVVDKTVVRDPIEKSRELCCRPVTLPGANNSGPGFLVEVLCGVLLPTKPQQIPVQRIIVTSIQFFERRYIAVPVAQH